MIKDSVQYVLCRIEDDSSLTTIGSYDSMVEGMVAAAHVVENVDLDYAHALYSSNGCKVVAFCEGRIGYREWALRSGRLQGEYIHALDDRYDHDVDELVST